ncbi:MAG: hypothetical protein UMU04_03930 [Halanaerobiales bacterium]|nr:hypothetical protein [Halanaerobiales bacterium]
MKKTFIALTLIIMLIISLPAAALELELNGKSTTEFDTGNLEINDGSGNNQPWAGDDQYFDAADPFEENAGVAYEGFGLNYGLYGVPWEGHKFDTEDDLRNFKTELLLNIKSKDSDFLNIDLAIDSTANLLDNDEDDEKLAEYLISLNKNGWNFKFGNKLNPDLNPYIMGTVVDDNDNFSVVNLEGVEISKNFAGINFTTIAAREERSDFYQDTFFTNGYLGSFGLTGDIDQDAFDSFEAEKAAVAKANYYGLKAEKDFTNGLYLSATAVQKDDKTDYEDYTYFDGISSRDNSQNNLGLNLVYSGLQNFSFIVDYAAVNYDSSFDDTRPNAGDIAFGQDNQENTFSQIMITTTTVPNAKITALYKNAEENYLAARTNQYILDSAWPTGIFGYRKGYKISGSYNLPFAFKPVLKLSYSDMDWTRTQAGDEEDDNEELMSSSLTFSGGPWTTTLAYSSSTKSNDTNPVEMLADQARQQAQNAALMDNYGEFNGYRGAHEWKKDVSSLSTTYALIDSQENSLNLNAGYTVKDYKGNDTFKDATNPNIADSVTMEENIIKVGINGSRSLSQKTTIKAGYNYEDRELNDIYGVEGTASLGTFSLGVDYVISETMSFTLEYNNLNYNQNNNNDNLTDPAYNTYPNAAEEGAARTEYFNDDYSVNQIIGSFTVKF